MLKWVYCRVIKNQKILRLFQVSYKFETLRTSWLVHSYDKAIFTKTAWVNVHRASGCYNVQCTLNSQSTKYQHLEPNSAQAMTFNTQPSHPSYFVYITGIRLIALKLSLHFWAVTWLCGGLVLMSWFNWDDLNGDRLNSDLSSALFIIKYNFCSHLLTFFYISTIFHHVGQPSDGVDAHEEILWLVSNL